MVKIPPVLLSKKLTIQVQKLLMDRGWKCADKRHWPREAFSDYLVSHPVHGMMDIQKALKLEGL